METIGGSNILGDVTLRGFRNYRFRDRDYFLVQTEFLRELRGPINLITFYDFGKVAPSWSRFDDGRTRQTFGGGIVVIPYTRENDVVRKLGNVMFRLYVGMGSGEGIRTHFGISLSGRGSRITR